MKAHETLSEVKTPQTYDEFTHLSLDERTEKILSGEIIIDPAELKEGEIIAKEMMRKFYEDE